MATTLSERGQSTRQKILSESRSLLVRNGYDALVLRDVAARCEIKLGNLQYYFKTREDLIYALINAEASEDLKTIEEALSSIENAEVLLDAVIRQLLARWIEEGIAVYSTLALLRVNRPAFRQLHEEIYRNHYKAIEQVIERFPEVLTDHARKTRAQLITALIDGAALQVPEGSREVFFQTVRDHARAIALGDR